jgi:hypothetical protein
MSNMPRTTAARRPDRPAGVSMNLDTLKREVIPEPFVAVIGGKAREFADPEEMDWQELDAAANDPKMILQLALSEDDYRDVMGMQIPAWKIKRVALAYIEHYGFDASEAQGNGSASPS